MTWYRIYFLPRKTDTWGKDPPSVLVEGEAERDRILARKVPKAQRWEVAKNYTCVSCGRQGPWTDGWQWFGSYAELDDGKPVIFLCSDECREIERDRAGSRTVPDKARPHLKKDAWKKQRQMHRWEALPQVERNERYRLQGEIRDAAGAHRKFKMPQWPKERTGKGWCRWCGEEIIEDKGKNAGNRSKRRTWHPACLHQWQLHTDRHVQARFLLQRDGVACPICGEFTGEWTSRGTYQGVTYIVWRSDQEVDHITPLWKSPMFSEAVQRLLHGPKNLWLPCSPCHKAKSALEAAERAELRRKGGAEA